MPASLTARFVENAKPDASRRLELPDGALPGFYLVVQPSGAKSWAVRYRVDGKPKKFTLGPYPRLSLGDAREQARAALRLASEGRDPAALRTAAEREADAITRLRFGAVVAEFIERYAKPRNRTWPETERLLTKADLASWQDRDLRSISRQEILFLLDRMVERGAPIQANRLVAALRRFFAWAVERGFLDVTPMDSLKPPSAEVHRDRVLSDDELRAIWLAGDEIGYPFGRAAQLMILTGQRRSEVLEARWREFDLDSGFWNIPRERAKNGTGHVIPLPSNIVAFMKRLPMIGASPEFVFTTDGTTPFSGVSKAVERLRLLAEKQIGTHRVIQPWRLHDLRRTFATGCARLGVPLHVVEKCLNHTSGTFHGVVAVYQRHEFMTERRSAVEVWGAFVSELVSSQAQSLVPIPTAIETTSTSVEVL
ncbi:integrase arm-type DNA-binding domain-containing protein [Microvirga aerilata]|uniref:Integrase arm-type DNA-binding domain-containing protein n=1 Tax=Microvirga aerilata TaxID=670292 RepID=A0A937CW22_9HYPH|nr:site-specific integrase [Microvirga aerilata]MBL0402688.1 integrase arm-type DNA-binding domain-containing protein [Microvirga aerilata]